MALPPLPPVNSQLPITVDGKLPAPDFVQQLNAAFSAQAAQIATLNGLVAQIQAVQAQAAAAQQAANGANSAPPASQRQGSASATLVVDDSGWTTTGPLVALATVSAGALTGNVTLGPFDSIVGGSSTRDDFSITTTAQAILRIQEIVGVSETTVFDGTAYPFTCEQVALISGGGSYAFVDFSALAAALAAWAPVLATTGSVSYRADFEAVTPGATINNLATYLYVKRA